MPKKITDYEIIDSHAHIYPLKIALKASKTIGAFYSVDMYFDGTVENLLEEGKAAGVNGFLVHSVATTPEQVSRINEFLYREISEHKEFIGFMTLHPDMTYEQLKAEIDLGIERGFKGIKLHPDFQKFYFDGGRAENIMKAVDGRIPLLIHAGDRRYGYSKPERISKMAKRHPEINFIAAHFGGYSEWDSLDCYLGLNNVYFDTSSSLFALSSEKAKGFIEKFGAERYFFGTDYPMWSAKEELERIQTLNLSEKELEMILSGNLKKLLKI